MEEVKACSRNTESITARTTSRVTSSAIANSASSWWQASKELEMMPTTEGGLDLKLDLTHVIDGFHGNEHTLPITPLYKDVLGIVRKIRHRGNADAHRELRRPVRRRLLVRIQRSSRQRETESLHSPQGN